MKGSCHCGAVRYEVARVDALGHCHCITCRKTHSAVAARENSPYVILRAASLDDDPGERPERHIWRSHDVPWLADDAAIPSFAEFPPGS